MHRIESPGLSSSDLDLLLKENKRLKKEKEEEMVLRNEAEKQVELTLQQSGEMQKRMSDWKIIQDAAMKDSKSAIIDIGNVLYFKLTKDLKIKVDEVKNLLEQMDKRIESIEKAVHNLSKK